MEEAITYYQKYPVAANLTLFRFYADGPTFSYSTELCQNDEVRLVVTTLYGIKSSITSPRDFAQFKTFLLDHNKTQEEYVVFLDEFLIALGNKISLEGLSFVIGGTNAIPLKNLFVNRFVSQVQDHVKRFDALRWSVLHRDEFVTRALIEHGVPHSPYVIELCRKIGWNGLADQLEARNQF